MQDLKAIGRFFVDGHRSMYSTLSQFRVIEDAGDYVWEVTADVDSQ